MTSRQPSPIRRVDDVASTERSSAWVPGRGLSLALVASIAACAADPRIVLGDDPGGAAPAGYTRFAFFSLEPPSDGEACLREREMYVRLDAGALLPGVTECRMTSDRELNLVPGGLPEDWWVELGWATCDGEQSNRVMASPTCGARDGE